MDAFDTDVLIYAAAQREPEGIAVRQLFERAPGDEAGLPIGVGSTLLVPEIFIKPIRQQDDTEIRNLRRVIAQLVLYPCDAATAELAMALGVRYGLKTVDAVHLATAVNAGADRFITNNRKDFSKDIEEIDITYPEDLAATSA